jgi:hypothetical protein
MHTYIQYQATTVVFLLTEFGELPQLGWNGSRQRVVIQKEVAEVPHITHLRGDTSLEEIA